MKSSKKQTQELKNGVAKTEVDISQEHALENVRDNVFIAGRVLWLTGNIEDYEQLDIIKWLYIFDDGSDKPVLLIINSLGGDVYVMNAIIDVIERLKQHGIKVYTNCIGTAMSAAALVLSSGSKGCRYISPNSCVMIHSAQSWGAENQSKTKDISIQAKWMERIQDSMENILAKNTCKTVAEIKKAVEYETYFSAKEAVKFGIADKVGIFEK